jgi:hypothetical protein
MDSVMSLKSPRYPFSWLTIVELDARPTHTRTNARVHTRKYVVCSFWFRSSEAIRWCRAMLRETQSRAWMIDYMPIESWGPKQLWSNGEKKLLLCPNYRPIKPCLLNAWGVDVRHTGMEQQRNCNGKCQHKCRTEHKRHCDPKEHLTNCQAYWEEV